MSVGPQPTYGPSSDNAPTTLPTSAAVLAGATKSKKRWVGDAAGGHWVDENGQPTDSPTAGASIEKGDDLVYNPNQRGAGGDVFGHTANPDYVVGDFTSPGHPGAATSANTGGSSAPAASADGSTADRARQLAEAAANRHTVPGQLDPSLAAPAVVDRTGTTQPVVTPGFAGRTTAPDQVHVDPITGLTIAAPTIAGPNVDQGGRALQQTAAGAYQDMLAGRNSLAESQLHAAQDKAAAVQLSIAAGARGQNVASARRNAAANVGLQQMEAGGQFAELRAKEIADAAAGLGTIGGQIQGQSLAESGQVIDVGKANAGNTVDVGKANQVTGKDVSIVNQQTDKDIKLSHAKDQLTADLASDDRLQTMLGQAADLKQRAAAGDQAAAVQLNALQANLQTEVAKFNATQIQTANASNIENRLRAMGMDDQYVAQMTQLWITAEQNKDQNALNAIKVQLDQEMVDNQSTGNALNFVSTLFGSAATLSKLSDRTAKKNVKSVDPSDIDGFLKAIGKSQTWEYKDPANGKGRKLGPMAQDMAADKLASQAVGKRSDGKMSLDYQSLAALALAGLGRVNARLEAVEGHGKRKADVAGFLTRGKR